MGTVPKYTTEQRVLLTVGLPIDDAVGLGIIRAFRTQVIKEIRERYWDCAIHATEHYHNPNGLCDECKEAQEVNVIISHILEVKSLQYEDSTT